MLGCPRRRLKTSSKKIKGKSKSKKAHKAIVRSTLEYAYCVWDHYN